MENGVRAVAGQKGGVGKVLERMGVCLWWGLVQGFFFERNFLNNQILTEKPPEGKREESTLGAGGEGNGRVVRKRGLKRIKIARKTKKNQITSCQSPKSRTGTGGGD